MKKLFSLLMILAAFLILPGCGSDDGNPGGGTACSNASQNAVDAIIAFQSDINAATCQVAIDAYTAAVNACDGIVGQDELDAWNDFIAMDPCDGL